MDILDLRAAIVRALRVKHQLQPLASFGPCVLRPLAWLGNGASKESETPPPSATK